MKNPKIRFCKLYNTTKYTFVRMVRYKRYQELTLIETVRAMNKRFGINLTKNEVYYWLRKWRKYKKYLREKRDD